MLPSQVCQVLRGVLDDAAATLIPPTVVTMATLSADDLRHHPDDRLHQTAQPYGLGPSNEGQVVKHLGWSLHMPESAPIANNRLRDSAARKAGTIELLLGFELRASRQQADADQAVDLIHRMNAQLWRLDHATIDVVSITTDHELVLLPEESLFMVLRSRLVAHYEENA